MKYTIKLLVGGQWKYPGLHNNMWTYDLYQYDKNIIYLKLKTMRMSLKKYPNIYRNYTYKIVNKI